MNIIVIISLLIIVGFTAAAILFFKKGFRLRKSAVKNSEEGRGGISESSAERWQGILIHLNSANESEWKLAIIEADKIVDDLLIKKGYEGESMAERLSLLDKKELKSFDLLWEAHKVRNRIAHKLDFSLNRSEALRAISYYEEALKDLEALS